MRFFGSSFPLDSGCGNGRDGSFGPIVSAATLNQMELNEEHGDSDEACQDGSCSSWTIPSSLVAMRRVPHSLSCGSLMIVGLALALALAAVLVYTVSITYKLQWLLLSSVIVK